MSTAIAKNLMAEMKLLGMFAAFDQAVTDATRDQTSYTEFSDALLQAEADHRQERKPAIGTSARRAIESRRPSSPCDRRSKISTSPPAVPSARHKSRRSTAYS